MAKIFYQQDCDLNVLIQKKTLYLAHKALTERLIIRAVGMDRCHRNLLP